MAETSTHLAPGTVLYETIVHKDLFPLALTPFEHYLLLDDSPQRPMTSFLELEFSTQLDAGTVERSLAIAIHRNPLFASLVMSKGRSWQWIYDPHFQLRVSNCSDIPPAPLGRPRPIDLTREQGIRVWYQPTQFGSTLTFQIHHACSDGVGIRRLLVDFLRAYAQLCSGEPRALLLDQLDARILSDRGIYGSDQSGGCRSSLSTWQRLLNAHYFFFQPPQALAVPTGIAAGSQAENSADNPTCRLLIDLEITAIIQEKARKMQVGLNDLALALLLHTCCSWNQEFARTSKNRRLRILMPFDLRNGVHFRMPAANRMSFAFLGRTYRECSDWTQLLQSVQTETRAIKDSRLSLDFLNGLSAVTKTPWLLRWLLKRCRPAATIVLTNGGDVFRGLDRYFQEEQQQRLIGDARLKSVFGAPPVRSGTNVSLGMCISAGQLCYSAAWSRDDFTAAACNLFLQRYVTAWKNWAFQDHPGA